MTDHGQHPGLQAFHDGELSPAAAGAVKAHIASCPACREELKALRSLDVLLKRKEPFSDISSAVMERVGAAAPAAGPLGGWWKLPAMALASIAIYAFCVESGLLPERAHALTAAVAAQREAGKASALLFGGSAGSKEELLAMLLEGDNK